jgi:hypothetical protein
VPHGANNPRTATSGQGVEPSPVHTIRYGTIQAAIWRNVVDNGNASRPMYGVTFSRSYKDGDGNWKDSASFGFDDLLLLAKAANDAHSYIHGMRQKDADMEK